MQAKILPSPEKDTHLQQALAALIQAKEHCAEQDKAVVMGNLGYTHFQLGQRDEAEHYTRESLQLGGERQYQAQLADARQHRTPNDSDYEAILHRLWQGV